jgi:hypothetical protein
MLVVPVQPIPSQTFTVILADQQVEIKLRQLASGLYMNLISNQSKVIVLVICQNLNRIVRDLYLGFVGDLVFLDNTGQGQDPFYTGLGTRYTLMYLSVDDLPVGVG